MHTEMAGSRNFVQKSVESPARHYTNLTFLNLKPDAHDPARGGTDSHNNSSPAANTQPGLACYALLESSNHWDFDSMHKFKVQLTQKAL